MSLISVSGVKASKDQGRHFARLVYEDEIDQAGVFLSPRVLGNYLASCTSKMETIPLMMTNIAPDPDWCAPGANFAESQCSAI